MSAPNSVVATGVSDESVSSTTTEQTNRETKSELSPADALIQLAEREGLGAVVDADVPVAQADEQTPAATETETDETVTDTTPAEDDTPAADEKKTVVDEPKGSIQEQIDAYKAKGEKPPWYLSRISEENAAKHRHRDRADKAEAEVQRLTGMLGEASAPRPTPTNPFPDIYDEAGLQRLEQTYESVLEFTAKNQDGAENVLVGKDRDGKEIRKDFTADEVAEMRVKAERALRKDIPQRRAYLAARGKADATAVEIYGDFKDPNSEYTKQAMAILRASPELETLVGPEVLIWIGHALKGRELFLASQNGKNGNGKADAADETTRRITKAAQTKVAPTPTRTVSITERRTGADVTAAEKKLEATGSEEDAVAYLSAQRQARQRGTVKSVAA